MLVMQSDKAINMPVWRLGTILGMCHAYAIALALPQFVPYLGTTGDFTAYLGSELLFRSKEV
jgi:hypothetical protein